MCDKIYTLDEIKSIAAPIAKQYGVDAMYQALVDGFQKDLDLLTSQNIEPDFLAAIQPEEVLVYAQ